MSRSGYTDDCENNWGFIRWRGNVASAIRGKKGQAFLREMAQALDSMPEKRLIAGDFGRLNITRRTYDVCALGSVCLRRGIGMEAIDPVDYDRIADVFGITHQLVREIEYLNDEAYFGMSDEGRWDFMREWVRRQIKEPVITD
jgi:hypothetical protein